MSPASRKIPPFLRNRYKAIYSNFSGDSVHQTVKSGPFGDRRSLLSENPGSGLELFAAVFQNTRVIWLLYKQRQDLIQKSTLRIHGKRRKMKSTAEPPGTRQCVRALRLSHMKLRTAFPRGRSAHGGSPSRLPLGSAGRRAARRLHGSSGESGGQRSVSPCSSAEGPPAGPFPRQPPGTSPRAASDSLRGKQTNKQQKRKGRRTRTPSSRGEKEKPSAAAPLVPPSRRCPARGTQPGRP